ncbi:MAG: DUF859 family phage minor structural protein [Bacilli bacterium]|nr:DUF859 family phage minor structural protein [Bacilli bacterium]
MALQTKTISANGSKGHNTFTLKITEDSTDITNNTSSLSFTFSISAIYGEFDWYYWGNNISYNININGINFSGYIPNYDGLSTVVLKSGNGISVIHNNDGTKDIPISFSVVDNAGQTYTCGNANSSGVITLTPIPRASNFTVLGDTLGSEIVLDITRANENFIHNIEFAYGNSGYSVIEEGVTTSASFKPSLSYAQETPNAPSGIGYIKVTTFNNDTYIGEKIFTFTCYIPDSIVPTISSILLSEDNNIPDNFRVYVKNKSKIKVNVNASGVYGSSIKQYSIKINGTSYSDNNITTELLNVVGDNTCEVTVTDSRGRSSIMWVEPFIVFDYENPSITKLAAEREEIETNVLVTISANIYNVNDKNAKTFTLKYKKRVESEYITALVIEDTYTIQNGTYLLTDIDDSSTYDLVLEAKDSFTTISYFITITTAYTLMDLKANGKGIAFGKASEKENTLESALNIECKNLNVNGDLLINEHPLLDLVYPVGSIYLSTSDLNPSTFFGGLWEQIAQGKTLIGVGTGTDINEVSKTFAVGDTGGEYEHTLTIDEMPNHQHDVNDFSYGRWGITVTGYNDASGWNTPSIRSLTGAGSSGTLMAAPAGKGLSHNNMQPYLAIYIWKRIS